MEGLALPPAQREAWRMNAEHRRASLRIISGDNDERHPA
jgi:hypothetical protein